jgi:hypothetical protein
MLPMFPVFRLPHDRQYTHLQLPAPAQKYESALHKYFTRFNLRVILS